MADKQVVWQGADAFSRWLQKTPAVTMKDLASALYQEGENAMTVSVDRTPWDTGRLKSTGHVKLPKERGGTVEVELAYGTDYAIYVHEIESNQHPRGGRAKFLQSAVEEAAAGMGKRLKARVLDRIGRRL